MGIDNHGTPHMGPRILFSSPKIEIQEGIPKKRPSGPIPTRRGAWMRARRRDAGAFRFVVSRLRLCATLPSVGAEEREGAQSSLSLCALCGHNGTGDRQSVV